MASEEHAHPLAESGMTIRSDSEQYSNSAPEEISASPSSSSRSAVVVYKPPTFWSILRAATINLFLPFINGMMLGFGELLAHEVAFRLGWSNTRVCMALHCLTWIMLSHGAGLPRIKTSSTHCWGRH